ncbi:MAG: hypothetical protein LAN37_16590 [Acidobacteriia bacterium]|nr:hypothetical protein [Terriglobia bacterium]
MKLNPHLRQRHSRQDGYMLLVIVLMLALALIAMSATAPYVITEIKRDREDELIHRGKQYQRAIKLFFKKFGRYPTSLAELQNTQNVHFLRKLYKDPMTPDGEWRLIRFGEAKYFPKGFGYTNIPGAAPVGGGPGGGPGASPIGGGFGGALLPGGMSKILGGSSPSASSPSGSSQSNQPNTSGMTPAEQISKPLGTGATIGAPIIGVASKNTDVSIHEVNERSHFNEWEFFYDPRFDIAAQMSVMPGGLPGQQGQQPHSGGGPGKR